MVLGIVPGKWRERRHPMGYFILLIKIICCWKCSYFCFENDLNKRCLTTVNGKAVKREELFVKIIF